MAALLPGGRRRHSARRGRRAEIQRGRARRQRALALLGEAKKRRPMGRLFSCSLALDRRRSAVDQVVVLLVLEVLVEVPALHLRERVVELRARQRLEDEALAARELAEVPWMCFL